MARSAEQLTYPEDSSRRESSADPLHAFLGLAATVEKPRASQWIRTNTLIERRRLLTALVKALEKRACAPTAVARSASRARVSRAASAALAAGLSSKTGSRLKHDDARVVAQLRRLGAAQPKGLAVCEDCDWVFEPEAKESAAKCRRCHRSPRPDTAPRPRDHVVAEDVYDDEAYALAGRFNQSVLEWSTSGEAARRLAAWRHGDPAVVVAAPPHLVETWRAPWRDKYGDDLARSLEPTGWRTVRTRYCEVCGRRFTATRRDATTCPGSKCRQRKRRLKESP